MTARAEIGVIGGSGFYDLDALTDPTRIEIETPWGTPSSEVVIGTVGGRRVAFIARHGAGHHITPTDLPAHANIYALKTLGVTHVLTASAVGSLAEQYRPGDAVIPDQLIDRTDQRRRSYFGDGAVAHVALADPFCGHTARTLAAASAQTPVETHTGGTLVVVEGPRFSTRAESRMFQQWGGDIIGMTAMPEAQLAREAELCYAALCFVTDYDTWHETAADVRADLVIETLLRNVERARAIVLRTIATLGSDCACDCREALGPALITDPAIVPAGTRARLGVVVQRYWDA